MRAREDTAYLFKSLGESFMGRVAARDLWWDKEDWDFFEIVITGTDRLFHTRWDAVEDPSHPNHGDCIRYFQNIDRFIGKTLEKFGTICGRETPEEGFFLLSDHGFCGIRQEVYLNSWLRGEGYLGFSGAEPKGIADITDDTRAFALDPSRIYIHAKGRFPRGCVSPKDVPALKKEIAERLRRLTYQGDPVIEEVHDTREIYEGDCVDLGPDLVAVGRHGFDLKGSVKEGKVFARTDLTGMHTWDDAFFWSGDARLENLNIVDICGILLGQCIGG
jgi:predicted AlkP superfamily phosphohydrolase/phosphomutase